MSYQDWIEKVDQWLVSKIGLTHLDLPDYMTRAAYDDGESPEETAMCILEASCDDLGVEFEEIMEGCL